MPLPLVAAAGAGIIAVIRQIAGGFVLATAFSFIKRAFFFIVGKKAVGSAAGTKGILGRIFDMAWKIVTASELIVILMQAGRSLLGWIGLGGAVVGGGANAYQMYHLLANIGNPQKAVVDWIADALASGNLPGIGTLIAQADAAISSTEFFQYISPVPTVTNVLQITGVGWAIDQILMCTVQNVIFIFSVWLMRWGFQKNFTFTKSIQRPASR